MHTTVLSKIKREIGASYLSYLQRGDKYLLKVIKDKDTSYFELTGTPQYVGLKQYGDLRKQLIEYYGKEA